MAVSAFSISMHFLQGNAIFVVVVYIPVGRFYSSANFATFFHLPTLCYFNLSNFIVMHSFSVIYYIGVVLHRGGPKDFKIL